MESISNSKFLLPNISIDETIEIIKDKIKNKIPFALTRFGDGEIYLINRNGSEQFLKKCCGLWNYKYPEECNQLFNDSNEVMKNAFINSDIVGLMDPKTKIVKIAYDSSTWSLEKNLVESWSCDVNKLKICDHMISRSLELGNIDSMKKVLNGHSVNIISPNTEILIPKQLEKRLETEVGFTHHSQGVNFRNRDEFMKNFEKIKEDVVLLGVGPQKDYGVILRDEFGKIVLDMGATMDAWSGIISRPWFNKGKSQEHLLV